MKIISFIFLFLLQLIFVPFSPASDDTKKDVNKGTNVTMFDCPDEYQPGNQGNDEVQPKDKKKSFYFDISNNTLLERLPFSDIGTQLHFILPEGTAAVNITEEKRKSRIADEFTTILKAIKGEELNFFSGPKGKRQCVTYRQKYKRSTVKIVALDLKKTEITTRTLTAGPREHMYLSADVPVTNIKQLTYDSSTSSIVEKDVPASFYLGINWQVGDVFTDYSEADFLNNFSVKFLLKASNKPSESIGVGLGYSFNAIDIFAARIRTKDDASVGGASLGHTDATVVGVSFNITKGLEWIKKD